jgi:Colicin E5 ribonuclease domain
VAYVGAGIITPDEVRERMGLKKKVAGDNNPLPQAGEGRVRATQKYNPHHDERGRFTYANNAASPKGEDLPSLKPESSASGRGVDTAVLPAAIAAVPYASEVIAATAAALIADTARQQLKPVPLNMEGEGEPSQDSGNNTPDNGDSGKKPDDPNDDGEKPDWKFGAHKSEQKWQNRLKQREWTNEEITDTIKNGEKFPADNNVNTGNTAIRYKNPKTGKSVIRDEVTKEILQISEEGFKWD